MYIFYVKYVINT